MKKHGKIVSLKSLSVSLIWLTLGANLACAEDFSLSSQQIQAGKTLANAQVFNGFGCTGKNQSPQLQWRGAPAGTKSFAVTVYDPDAPTGSGWWHWTVLNIPAHVHELPAGASPANLPAGVVEGRTDYGQAGFGGACPPVGDKPHRYQFTVWALNTEKLELDQNSSGALVGYMVRAHALGKAELQAYYAR